MESTMLIQSSEKELSAKPSIIPVSHPKANISSQQRYLPVVVAKPSSKVSWSFHNNDLQALYWIWPGQQKTL